MRKLLITAMLLSPAVGQKPKSNVHVAHIGPDAVIVTCNNDSKPKVSDIGGMTLLTCSVPREQ